MQSAQADFVWLLRRIHSLGGRLACTGIRFVRSIDTKPPLLSDVREEGRCRA